MRRRRQPATRSRAAISGLVLVIAAGLAADCSRQHENADFLPTSPLVQGALTVLLSAQLLPADGISTLVIVARLDPTSDSRKVVFETTKGQFLDPDGSDSSKRTRTVEADIDGEAEARLRSDREVGTATVTVSVRGPSDPADPSSAEETKISRTVTIEFVAISPDTISFTVAGDSLPADGFSVLDLLARVDPELPQSYKAITFEATAPGKIVGGTTSGGTSARDVTADAAGEASAQLTSDSASPQIGRSQVTARLKNFPEIFQSFDVDFVPRGGDQLLLSAAKMSIPADGFSSVELLATIDPSSPPNFRDVKFTTTGGSFVGIGTVSGNTITVTADTSGEARTSLRSDRSVRPVEVRAELASDSSVFQSLFIDFVSPDAGALILLTASSPSADADGESQTRITAVVSAELAGQSPQPRVNFTTSLGKFAETNGTSAPNRTLSGDRASVTLVSSTTLGTAFLTAEADGFVAAATVALTRAFPDFIAADAGAFTLSKAANAAGRTITVTLRRDAGRGEVSEGTVVSYSIVKQSDGSPIGDIVFRNITPSTKSGSTQVSTAKLITTGSAFTGLAIVRATVAGSSAAAGEDTIDIVP